MRLAALVIVAVAVSACGSHHKGTATSPALRFTPTLADIAAVRRVVLYYACGKGHKCKVSAVRFARSDPSYAIATISDPKIGVALAMLRHKGKHWKVIDLGTAYVGCSYAPRAVRIGFALNCPDDRSTTQQAAPPASPATTSAAPVDPYRGKPGDKDFAVEYLQLNDDGIGDIGGIARIKNVSSKQLTVTFTFTFFQSGRIVGTAQGNANEVAPGQTITAQLVSQDKLFNGSYRYQFQVDAEF